MSARRLRPVDLAREHGLSAQAIRNYEEEGILPTAGRTRHGYRIYTPLHARALRAFVALVPAHGHGTAADVMRAVNAGDVDAALTLLDESHAQLLRDKETLTSVDAALRDLASSEAGRPSPRGVVFIGGLARDLGVGPATLRKWEKAGLIGPRRDSETGYRVYGAEDVRDARLAHQLRRGGYLLRQIAPLIERVRHAGGWGRWKRPSTGGAPGSGRAVFRCSPPRPSYPPMWRTAVTHRPPSLLPRTSRPYPRTEDDVLLPSWLRL